MKIPKITGYKATRGNFPAGGAGCWLSSAAGVIEAIGFAALGVPPPRAVKANDGPVAGTKTHRKAPAVMLKGNTLIAADSRHKK